LEDQAIRKVFQNGLYDIAFLWRSYGIKTLGGAEDTMLLHHALQPEALKGLAFLGSVYTNHGPWKSERKTSTETIKRDA
jgi:DNA polymerase I-like protein with 3'-5' exonuclease and polymerase domains